MSRQELADAMGRFLKRPVDVKYVGKLERGRIRWPNDEHRQALRTVLGVENDADIGLFVTRGQPTVADTRTPQRSRSTVDADRHSLSPSDQISQRDGGHNREDQDMQRRHFLEGFAGMGVGWTLQAVPLPTEDGRRIGSAHVRQIEDALAHLRTLDDRYGGEDLHELTFGLLSGVNAMLNHGSHTATIRERLQVLAGLLAAQTGWLSFDAGRQDRARHFLTEALTPPTWPTTTNSKCGS